MGSEVRNDERAVLHTGQESEDVNINPTWRVNVRSMFLEKFPKASASGRAGVHGARAASALHGYRDGHTFDMCFRPDLLTARNSHIQQDPMP